MIEVIWHGRGGQGAFTGARLLGAAWCLEDGHHALAFPTFGPERRGAPMRAFTKLGASPVGDRCACICGDVVVYLDETLFGPSFERELKPGAVAVVNAPHGIDDPRVRTIDADGISRTILGRAIPNTALLAALTNVIDGFSPDQLKRAIELTMAPRLHEANFAIVDAALASFAQRSAS